MKLPTASAIDTALICLGSCVLRVADEQGEAAATGHVIHRFLERAPTDRTAALAEIDDDATRERCAAIDLSQIPAGAEREVAMAWDPETDTGEILRLDGHRRYPEGARYYGTADLVGRIEGGVWVGDYKTGTAFAASDSWQLRALALMAARAVQVDAAEVSMIVVDHRGRLRPDRHSLDGFDLDETAERLRQLARDIRDADPRTVPLHAGPHCRYCRALLDCPAQTALVAALPGKLRSLEEKVASLTTEEAGDAWGLYYEAAARLETIKEALRLRVEAGEEPTLPDGRRMVQVRSSSVKKSDTAKAELRALSETLEQRGEIWSVPTVQVRPVGRKKSAWPSR